MSKRTMLMLAGVLVLQVVLGVALWLPRQVVSDGGPLFPGLELAQVSGVVISDSTGNSIHLARQGDGWILPESDSFPADGARIESAVTKLLAVAKGAPVTETAASHARLQVADDAFMRRIELQTRDGAAQVVLLGSSPGFGDAYVRLPGEDTVYQGREVSAYEWSSAATGWVDTLYLSVPQEQVTALRLTNAQGELRLTRLDNGGWALADQPVDYVLDETAVNTLVQRATTVRLTAPLGMAPQPAYGLDAPQATVTIVTADGEESLLVGAADADGSAVVKASSSAYYVRVAQYTAQDLLDASVETLRQVEQPAAQ